MKFSPRRIVPLAGPANAIHSTATRCALPVLEKVARPITARPRDLTLRRQAARLHNRAGSTERAIGHLEVAIRLAPHDGTIWLELADRERDRENVADAYVAYRRASSLEPNDLRAIGGLARSAEDLGFDEEAQAAYERLAQLERGLRVDGF